MVWNMPRHSSISADIFNGYRLQVFRYFINISVLLQPPQFLKFRKAAWM